MTWDLVLFFDLGFLCFSLWTKASKWHYFIVFSKVILTMFGSMIKEKPPRR